ncbi:MAG: chloride channel protein [Caldivirga sp.]
MNNDEEPNTLTNLKTPRAWGVAWTSNYYVKWFILGIVIGIVAGVSALAFYFTLKLMEHLFLGLIVGASVPEPVGEGGSLSSGFRAVRYWLIPVSTTLGGLLSGLIVYTWAPEAEGHGTDAAINAYHRLQGRIRRRIPPIKLVASAITIGSGGSAGREGPTAQLSAGIGSAIADLLKLSPDDRRRAVAVGIGAGIGSIFKAPIGGAILAAEVLYMRDIEAEVLFPALVASAVGYSIFGSVVGFTPIFGYYTGIFNPVRLPLYAVLGVIDGLFAVLYVKTFYAIHDAFKRWRISNYAKPVVGGLLAGVIGLMAPEVLGTSYGWVNLAEFERLSLFTSPVLPLIALLVALPFLKVLATSFTIGSGGSGGVFAPGIVIGALVGLDVGLLFHYLLPSLVPDVAPFVIVSMLALFGAAAKAPLAVMFMVVEMTGSYQLLPAAMIAVAIAYLISGGNTIYRAQVPTRRDSPAHVGEYDVPVLMEIRVSDCEVRRGPVVRVDYDVNGAINVMLQHRYTSLPVVNHNGELVGVVHLTDILGKRGVVGMYVKATGGYVRLDSTLYDAWEVMSREGTTWVPVVENERLIGILTMESMRRAYDLKIRSIKLSINQHA